MTVPVPMTTFGTCMRGRPFQVEAGKPPKGWASQSPFCLRWFDDRDADCLYRLIVQLLDANQAVLHHFSPLPFPSDRLGNGFFFEVSLYEGCGKGQWNL